MNESQKSRQIRVFISSTFRDFAEERDLLVKKIFPELRRRCRERKVELIDVDLRWGITEEEAQQGKVLPICLAEIDRARPYFMGMIGERYGWVPDADFFDVSLLMEQPWLEEHRGGKSVTELEILHGVLNNPAMEGRAFFYFRDPAYSQAKGGPYLSEDSESLRKLAALKDRLRHSGFPVMESYPTPEALADRVLADLWKLIDDAYPAAETPDPLAIERGRHEAYGAARLRLYLGGDAYFAALDTAMVADPFTPVLITGASGGGKSALLANWTTAHTATNPETLPHLHHLGASSDAADPVKLVTRIMQEIARATGEELTLESDSQKIFDLLPEWLARASAFAKRQGREWLIVLDGLDKLSSLRNLRWWPAMLPPGVKLIVSCLDGEVLDALRKRMAWTEVSVQPLSPAEQRTFITRFLGRYRKSLTPPLVERVQAHPLSGNPLFLITLLDELRVFGVHEELELRLTHYLQSATVDDLFERVLERVEADTSPEAVRTTMEAIWASRAGLAQDELLAITGLVPATWAPIHNALDEAILESGGRLTFGHDYFRKAVEDRYLPSPESRNAAHLRLAEWFDKQEVSPRVAEELPWQWQQACEEDKLKECLTHREMFMALHERDDYELLGYWLTMKDENPDAAYGISWETWMVGLSNRAASLAAYRLAAFLKNAGYFGELTEYLYRLRLEYNESALGVSHSKTLMVVNSLGSLLSLKGDYDGAEILFRRALDEDVKVFGLDHPKTLGRVNNLGVVLSNKGDYEGAEMLHRRALEGREKTLGPGHLETLESAINLSVILSLKGDYETALELCCRALDGREKVLGPYHPETLLCANNLGKLLYDKGDFENAEKHLRRALDGLETSIGPNHPDTLRSVDNLGELLHHKGEDDLAEALYRRGLEFRERSLGLEHPDTSTSVYNLGAILRHRGDLERAEMFLRRALEGREKSLGLEHPKTLCMVDSLGILLYNRGDLEGAEMLHRRALEVREKSLGLDHPDTLENVYNLGAILSAKDELNEAEILLRRALEGFEMQSGPAYEGTLKSVFDLGSVISRSVGPKHAAVLLSQYASLSNEGMTILRYNLACYECLSGNENRALQLIAEEIAMSDDPVTAKLQMLEDSDFQSIHELIRNLP